MPTFGDFETVGDPIATTEERGHASTVWRAVKPIANDGREYAVKCYVPRRSSRSTETETLSRDRGLEFLEGIKDQRKAQSTGGRSLAPIHAFGTSHEGAWYVTDFFPRSNLKAWITKKGRVNSAGLRHVVAELVAGCVALKQSRGYSHGNLKVSNAFRAGKTGTFHQTPILLTDPYPAGPARELDSQNTELLGRAMDAEDLRAIGEIMLQLVEGRLLVSSEDYNWPIASSPAWKNLGNDGDRWLQLCNQLLDGNRAPDSVSLESLAEQFRPRVGKGKLVLAVAATVVVIGVLAGGFMAIKSASAKRSLEKFRADLKAAEQSRDSTNLNDALAKVKAALARQPDNPEAAKLKGEIEADIDRAFNSAIQSGNAKLTPFTEQALTEAEKFLGAAAALKPSDAAVGELRRQIGEQREKLKQQETLLTKRTELTGALAEAKAAMDTKRWTDARTAFGRAARLAAEVQDPALQRNASDGLASAQRELDNRSAEERARQEIDDLMRGADATASTNNWGEAIRLLTQAQKKASDLKDQTLISNLDRKAKAAQDGSTQYEKEKTRRDEFVKWMNNGQTATDLNLATNWFRQALDRAIELKDNQWESSASNALKFATATLQDRLNRAQLMENFTQLMRAGTAAARTNGWSSATNSFGQASGVARRLGDSNRLAEAEAQLRTVLTQLEESGRRQKSLQELTALITQAQQAEVQKNWKAASNLFSQASALAEKLNDSRLTETRGGSGRAVAAMQREAQDDQYRAEAEGWMKRASGVAATNGWSAATNFYAQAIKVAGKLSERTLQLQAEAEYKNALEKRNAELSNQQRQTAYQQEMTSARQRLDLKDFQGAVDQANVALKNVPNDPGALRLKDDAEKKLAAVNQENLRKAQHAAAMAAANSSYKAGDYATAKIKAQEALDLQADDLAAKTLRDEAQTKLEQQGKIAAELAALDSVLQDLMKQFKVKAQGASILPERSAKSALRGAIQTDAYLKSSANLRELYKAKSPLDPERQKCLDALDSAITRWNASF